VRRVAAKPWGTQSSGRFPLRHEMKIRHIVANAPETSTITKVTLPQMQVF
jgi:hypothetical protein